MIANTIQTNDRVRPQIKSVSHLGPTFWSTVCTTIELGATEIISRSRHQQASSTQPVFKNSSGLVDVQTIRSQHGAAQWFEETTRSAFANPSSRSVRSRYLVDTELASVQIPSRNQGHHLRICINTTRRPDLAPYARWLSSVPKPKLLQVL